LAKEIGLGSWELVAADKAAVVAKPFFYALVVTNSKSEGRFPNSASANESDGAEGGCETKKLLDEPIATETGSRQRGR
jgi:hypothetical protein